MWIGSRAIWYATTVVLLVASTGAVCLLASSAVIPAAVRVPLSAFAWPGVTAWWLFFPSLFQAVPSSPTGVAFAAIANAAVWIALGISLSSLLRLAARLFATARQ